jgi:hypothetical protein
MSAFKIPEVAATLSRAAAKAACDQARHLPSVEDLAAGFFAAPWDAPDLAAPDAITTEPATPYALQIAPRAPHGVHAETVLFMRNTVTCPACRIKYQHGAALREAPPAARLHVVLRATSMIITPVDDLHRPGLSLVATMVDSAPHRKAYRLLKMPLPGVARHRHRPGNGLAMLVWQPRRWRLIVLGTAVGLHCDHGRIFDALEDAAA